MAPCRWLKLTVEHQSIPSSHNDLKLSFSQLPAAVTGSPILAEAEPHFFQSPVTCLPLEMVLNLGVGGKS